MANVKKLTVEDLKKIKGARTATADSIRGEDSDGNRMEIGEA